MRTAEEVAKTAPDEFGWGDEPSLLRWIRAIQREAFDAGARAAVDQATKIVDVCKRGLKNPWDVVAAIDITKLPGRPE